MSQQQTSLVFYYQIFVIVTAGWLADHVEQLGQTPEETKDADK